MQDEYRLYPLDTRYKVYRDGTIIGARGKVMKPSTDNAGRKHVMIGKSDNQTVHKMVALSWIPNPENLPCINHINGVCDDNMADNLEWCTHAYNMHHASVNNLMVQGSKHYLSKLDEYQVTVIKHLCGDGLTDRQIAKYFKVDRQTIRPIRKGLTWKHVRI